MVKFNRYAFIFVVLFNSSKPKLNIMRKFSLVFLTLSLLLPFNACQMGAGDDASKREAYAPYVQGHTAGVIASTDPVRLFLTQEVPGIGINELLSDKVVNIDPQIDGDCLYMGDGLVEFKPAKGWENGKSYTFTIHLDQLIQIPKNLKQFSFDFDVIPLDFSVMKGGISLNPKDMSIAAYQGKIRLSDQISLDDLRACFTLASEVGSPELELELINDDYARYEIINLERADENYDITLKWNGRNVGINQRGDLSITVPGKNQFDLLDVHVDQGSDQHIRIEFSAALDPNQDLNGLIYLQNMDELRIRKVDNQVFMYPQQRISGEWILKVEAGLNSNTGQKLAESHQITVAMDALPPKVEFLGSGFVLPNSDGLLLPIRTVNLRAIDVYIYRIYSNNIAQFLQNYQPGASYSMRNAIRYVGRPAIRKTIRLDQDPGLDLNQWNTFSIDLGPLIQQDPHALYHVEVRIRKPLAYSPCDGVKQSTDLASSLLPEQFSETEMAPWDDGEYYYEDLYPDDYDWNQQDNPCHGSYYTPSRFVYRNVLATNLGVLAKSSDQRNFLVAVTDLLSAEPISNASVEFFNFQQQQIIAATTDPDGILEITLEETPFLIVVAKDEQRVFLRVDDGSSLSMSNFNVSGQPIQRGIKGFLYGERGVWRPGDTLHMSFALFDKDDFLPDDIPVIFELRNAQDQLVNKTTKTEGMNGFYRFSTSTEPDALTGNWQAKVKVGGTQFTKNLKIETVKPNRIRMNLDFNRQVLVSYDPRQELEFSANWLHGAVAANLRTEVEIRLAESTTSFPEYDGYSFDDPVRTFWSSNWYIFDGFLSDEGRASVPLNLDVNQEAPGMLRAVFTSRVFEKGGDFSTDVMSLPFSPYDRYVGVKARRFTDPNEPLVTDTLHTVDVVSVDQTGKPVSVNGLIARVYKVGWRWWWSSGQDDLASYVGSRHENLVSESRISTRNGKGQFSFQVDYPNWGRYLLHISDPSGGHAAGQLVYMDWPAWVNRSGRSNPSGANMLTLSADKENYAPGEKAIITFPSMDDPRALVSIESGSRVFKN